MLAEISVSTGGFVPDNELAEALGAFLLRDKGGCLDGNHPLITGKLTESGNGDRRWWDYKGRRYATLWERKYNGIYYVSVLHFDYYEQL